jgi:hypothetical protein
VIFKRRDPKTYLRSVVEFLWPRGGWARAFHYVRHRLRRLPDSPERIARGIWAGVFAAFTPFYTMHFVVAVFMAKLMRGNMLASLMGTFFGNPLTYVPIAVMSLQTGHWLLGTEMAVDAHRSFGGKLADAGGDLIYNLKAVWMGRPTDWHGISVIIPGIVFGTICYYISVPLIRAYQHRRKGVIKAKFEALKAKAGAKAEAKRKA